MLGNEEKNFVNYLYKFNDCVNDKNYLLYIHMEKEKKKIIEKAKKFFTHNNVTYIPHYEILNNKILTPIKHTNIDSEKDLTYLYLLNVLISDICNIIENTDYLYQNKLNNYNDLLVLYTDFYKNLMNYINENAIYDNINNVIKLTDNIKDFILSIFKLNIADSPSARSIFHINKPGKENRFT